MLAQDIAITTDGHDLAEIIGQDEMALGVPARRIHRGAAEVRAEIRL
jgi:hypothetical protein